MFVVELFVELRWLVVIDKHKLVINFGVKNEFNYVYFFIQIVYVLRVTAIYRSRDACRELMIDFECVIWYQYLLWRCLLYSL